MEKAWPGVYVRTPNENRNSNDFYLLIGHGCKVASFNGQISIEDCTDQSLADRKCAFQSRLKDYVAGLEDSELSSGRSSHSSRSRYGERDSSSESNITDYTRAASNVKGSLQHNDAKSETHSYVSSLLASPSNWSNSSTRTRESAASRRRRIAALAPPHLESSSSTSYAAIIADQVEGGAQQAGGRRRRGHRFRQEVSAGGRRSAAAQLPGEEGVQHVPCADC